jgi:DNA repair exonuclease SbcCD nuclease subunit
LITGKFWMIISTEDIESMKILHTADVHLKKDDEKRLGIFEWMLRRAVEMEVDCFAIAGDLFESDTDATQLRQTVRKMFESVKYSFLIIPGNHDAHSFGPDYDYGKNVVQLTKEPFHPIERDGMRICGVPYQEKKFSDCIRNIPKNVDILIAHGTLYDQSFIFSVLEDIETEYMPIYPAHLDGIARYVALGHLHSRNIELKYGDTQVVYPGSPSALDAKCIDTRHFYSVEIDGSEVTVSKHRVDVAPYWVERDFFVFPDIENEVISDIESFLKGVDESTAMPNIGIRGYTVASEKEFKGRVHSVVTKFCERFQDSRIEIEVQSWDVIMKNRMVQRFVNKTQDLDDRLRTRVFEITFPIFDKVLR